MWFILNCQETSLKLTMDEKKCICFLIQGVPKYRKPVFFLRDA